MKRIITTDVLDPNIAQPFTARSLDFLQDATKEAIQNIISHISGGDVSSPTILWGCVETLISGTDYSCTAGAIFVSGEIYSVDAVATISIPTSSEFDLAITNDGTADPVTFTDATSKNVHNIRKAVYKDTGSVTSSLGAYSSFSRLSGTAERIIPLGGWNMNAAGGGTGTLTWTFFHGISPEKIRSCNVMINQDGLNYVRDLLDPSVTFTPSGSARTSGTGTITITTKSAGIFDNGNYNDDSINRGYITIRYTL